jgi:hypothetical protein
MSKVSPAKTRSKKSEAPARTKRAAGAERAERATESAAPARRTARPVEPEVEDEDADADGDVDARSGVMCRSCGKRPGRPTAILGQMTQAELCPQCTQLRKERIRLNRAAARGMRSSRLY